MKIYFAGSGSNASRIVERRVILGSGVRRRLLSYVDMGTIQANRRTHLYLLQTWESALREQERSS